MHSSFTVQIGSVVLFGLYLVVKYLGPEWINWLLQWYFTLTGIGSVGKVRASHVPHAILKAHSNVRPLVTDLTSEMDSWKGTMAAV